MPTPEGSDSGYDPGVFRIGSGTTGLEPNQFQGIVCAPALLKGEHLAGAEVQSLTGPCHLEGVGLCAAPCPSPRLIPAVVMHSGPGEADKGCSVQGEDLPCL